MNLYNFDVIVFHPNTEQKIIQLRNSLLQTKYKNFFPLFPLYACFQNFSDVLQSKEVNKDAMELSYFCNLKKEFLVINHFCAHAEFIYKNILFFQGSFFYKSKQKSFVIPVAIKNSQKIKTIKFIFSIAHKLILEIDKTSDLKNCPIEKINISTFQIGKCKVNDNQFYLYNNIWCKLKSKN